MSYIMSSNKSEERKDQYNNANTQNIGNHKQQGAKLQRQTSVIPTFFRWFKKPSHRKQQFHGGRSAIETSSNNHRHYNQRYESSSRESLNNFNSSQGYLDNHLSPSISCDSVVSTATTGFAFIKPNKYGNLVEPKILSDSQIHLDTNSLRRLRENLDNNDSSIASSSLQKNSSIENDNQTPKLTLREKYFLFESDTLKSNASSIKGGTGALHSSTGAYGNYDNILENKNKENIYINNNIENKELSPNPPNRRNRMRRAVSDSSKELQSGAYVHVKGKRKAPDPPSSNTNSIISSQSSNPFEDNYIEPSKENYRTLSPVSTYGRKKRKAPHPPLLTELQQSRLNFNRQNSRSPSISRASGSPFKDSIAEESVIEAPKKTEIIITKTILEVPKETFEKNDISTLLNKSEAKIYSSICEAGINRQSFTDKEANTSEKQTIMPFSPFKRNIPQEIRSPSRKSFNKNEEQIQSGGESRKNNNESPTVTASKPPTPPHSPISPRPWYKRPIPTNKESVIPFKREIALKTVEKRKSKQKDSPETNLPEVSFSRSSIFDSSTSSSTSSSKFSLFSRQKDSKSGKDKEKRLSGINMPNISELDREAAEILMNESKNQTNWNENKTYVNPPDQIFKLDQEMFRSLIANNMKSEVEQSEQSEQSKQSEIKIEDNKPEEAVAASPTAKELINKFEFQTEGPKVTINPMFIGRTDNFIGPKQKISTSEVSNSAAVITLTKDESIKTEINSDLIKPIKIENVNSENNSQSEEINSKNINKSTWSCSYCTLENPSWRIICEVCEHLKPPIQRQNSAEETTLVNKENYIKKTDVGRLLRSFPSSPEHQTAVNGQANDWEWKAEIVKKYFQTQDSSSSQIKATCPNSPKLQSILRKSPSPSRLPISSPRMCRSERLSDKKDILPPQNSSENKDKNINQLGKNDISSINLEQIRVARLAKFSIPPFNKDGQHYNQKIIINDDKTNFLNDPNSLEMEKKRLREKIRAMNAKALAEKHPIVTKNLSLDDPTQDSPPQIENNKIRPTSSIISAPIPAPRSSSGLKNEINKTKDILNATENILDVDDNNQYEENKSKTENPIKLTSNSKSGGAIKKVIPVRSISSDKESNLTHNFSNKPNNIEIYSQQTQQSNNKPNKVSSSCQTQTTSNVVKKMDNYESNVTLNALISPIKGQKYRQDGLDHKNINNETFIEYKKLSDSDREQVKEISKKLTSIEGRNNFKMSLDDGQSKGFTRTDTLVLNKILRNLEQAISEGKHELAAKLAMDLAKMKVSLQVTKMKPKKSISFDDEPDKSFIVDMFIEDRISQKGPIQITVKPSMTVRELKEKIYKDYNIPVHLQKWIINDELLYNEYLLLYDCGVKNNLASLYLYILSPSTSSADANNEINYKFTIPKTSKAFPEDDFNDKNLLIKSSQAIKNNTTVASGIGQNSLAKNEELKPWKCSLCTLINPPMALLCSACTKTKPLSENEKASISEELKKFLKDENRVKLNDITDLAKKINENLNRTTTTTITIKSSNSQKQSNDNKNQLLLSNNLLNEKKDNVLLRPIEQKNDLNKKSQYRKSTEIYNIVEETIKPETTINAPKTKIDTEKENRTSGIQQNFSSPNITKNKYRGVDNFNPFRKDTSSEICTTKPLQSHITNANHKNGSPNLNRKSTNNFVKQNSEPILKSPYSTSHYLELLKLDYSDVVRNFEPFDCSICFEVIEKGKGVILRECLHSFCRECLVNTIKYNEEAQVKCPFMDKVYSCHCFLQEREIKALVSKDIHEKHLAKSIKLAEHHIENAFHCKTANCRGWCIYEDNVNEFLCPVCNLKNCLTCGAIHDGITCKQYQDGLNDCDSNEDAKRTKEMFQEMVKKGEALNCPTCQVIMMKKWGCDWLKCSMCKTEVCWVTKGPRWGPAGKGDTSGGCKCGVNGVKCHPKCNYCH